MLINRTSQDISSKQSIKTRRHYDTKYIKRGDMKRNNIILH